MVPGTAAVSGIGVNSISCGAPGVCVLGGYHDGHGRGSDQVAFVAGSGTRPLTVPSPPHLKSAAPGNWKLTATWSKPSDKGGVPIAGYRVMAKSGSHVFTCSTKSKLNCTIAGLKNGTTYTVTVVARNTVGRSRPSNSRGPDLGRDRALPRARRLRPTGRWACSAYRKLVASPTKA